MADDNNFSRKKLPDESTSVRTGQDIGTNDGLINSPELNDRNKPMQRAIRDAGQAREIINALLESNRTRQSVNARIYARWNAERPYSQASLKAEGTDWRSNFTTKPLPQLVEKVFSRFSEVIEGLKFFTDSKLDDKWENSVEKTEAFRSGITELIRSRPGWDDLIEDVALDNSLFGSTVVAHLDEYSWFPKHFRHDEFFLPDGTKQLADSAQIVVLREAYLPHELFAYIEDKDAAEKAGWDISNTREVINDASPVQYKDLLSSALTAESWYEEARRNLNVGGSFTRGASVVQCYSLLVREVTGTVSHYRLAGTDLKLIFGSDDRFDSMEQCVAFFAFQKGNGLMHSSKGVGRDVYEFAGMIDRIRNEVVDRSVMSGKTLVQGDIRNLHKFKMSLLGSMAIVPAGWNFIEQKIDGNVDSMLRLDAYFQRLADQLVGTVSIPQPEGGSEAFRSSASWQLLASREEEQRDAKLSRFLKFFVKMIGTLQRRICDKGVDDKDAKAFQKKMLERMSREELDELAESPVASAIRDLTPADRQLTVALVAEKRGNPLYNARQLEVEDVTARLGADAVTRLILPENDPTVQAEQQRAQQIEFSVLAEGQPVPVSPRDNHEIHLSVLIPLAQSVAQAIMEGSTGTAVLEAVIDHVTKHYNFALQQGAPKEKLKPVAELVKNSGKILAEMKKLDQQAEQVSAESEQFDAEPQPPMIPQ